MAPDLGWNATFQGEVVKVTEHWIVAVVPMIFNDRIVLCDVDDWEIEYVAGFCYDKGPAAPLAAMAWDPEVEQYPVGYKKIACDSR